METADGLHEENGSVTWLEAAVRGVDRAGLQHLRVKFGQHWCTCN